MWKLVLGWIASFHWWLSRKKVQRLEQQLITRRGLLLGLISVPFLPAPSPQVIREQIVAEYIKTSAGRARLAQAMIMPLRRRLDYQSIAQKIFLVEQMPPGARTFFERGDV